jgi:hypothetical protein
MMTFLSRLGASLFHSAEGDPVPIRRWANGLGEWASGTALVPLAPLRHLRAMHIQGWSGPIGGGAWWARTLAFAASIGLLLALLGPYGSYYNPLSLRLLDWTIITTIGAALLALGIPPILKLGGRLGLPRLFALTAAILVIGAPAAVGAAFVTKSFWGEHVADYRWTDWYLQTLLLIAASLAGWALMEMAVGLRLSMAPSAARPEAEARGRILCLQMEDNYVRVHREAGSTLELMPLHRAIQLHGRGGGLQVHRGWWVADHSVVRAERDSRAWRLHLRNGLIAPVARNRVGQARARGWPGFD